MKKVYLAIPYSAISKHLEEERFIIATRLAGRLIENGVNCYSPITNSHPIRIFNCNPMLGDWQTWGEIDREMIDWCDIVYVICIRGWRDSVGVNEEIEHALSTGKPVVLIPPKVVIQYLKGERLFL